MRLGGGCAWGGTSWCSPRLKPYVFWAPVGSEVRPNLWMWVDPNLVCPIAGRCSAAVLPPPPRPSPTASPETACHGEERLPLPSEAVEKVPKPGLRSFSASSRRSEVPGPREAFGPGLCAGSEGGRPWGWGWAHWGKGACATPWDGSGASATADPPRPRPPAPLPSQALTGCVSASGQALQGEDSGRPDSSPLAEGAPRPVSGEAPPRKAKGRGRKPRRAQGSWPRPPLNYSVLISLALSSSVDSSLTVQEIYQFIRYRTGEGDL